MLFAFMTSRNVIKMTDKSDSSDSLEEEVFKTLSHQIRRDILRFIGEQNGAKFTEIKNRTGIAESASLSYHLNALSPLLVHEDDLYRLSVLGKDTYALMNKLVAYSASATVLDIINRQLGAMIIANALLWISALCYMIVVEGPLQSLTMSIFIVFFGLSSIFLYSTAEYAKS